MKFCTKCGNKLNENTKFCSKCGTPTNRNVVNKNITIKKEKKEVNKERLLLSIGTLLVIVASVIFAFANWNEMSSALKVGFLTMEALLFLSLSLFSKRVNFKMPYKALWFIGITFIPIILNLVATDAMLGEYLSYDGNGIYVYLAISSFVCALIYFISDKVIKSNVFLYAAYIFIYIMVCAICGIFKLETFEYRLLVLNILTLIISIFYSFIKNEKYNRTINIFISIVVGILCLASITYLFEIKHQIIIPSIICVTNLAAQILLIFKTKRNITIYFYPFIIFILLLFGIETIFSIYPNIILFISVLGIILINFIINLCSDRLIKNMTFIVMLNYLFAAICFNETNNLTLAIATIMTLLTFLFTIRLNMDKVQTSISKILLPVNLLLVIFNSIRVFVKMDASIIFIIVSVICFTIFVILNQKSKDKFARVVFEVFSYIFLIISSLIILDSKPTIVAFILNEIVWLYYFIFNSAIKRNKGITITLLVGLLINFALCSIRYSISFHYSLIFIAIITAILDFIEFKFNNKKSAYIDVSIVFTSLATITNFSKLSVFALGLNVLVYAASYLLFVKYHKPEFVFKFIYTLIGFALIDSVFNYFIDNLVISNILILVTYIVIIISMFLLEVDDDRKVLGYSGIIVYPYLNVVYNLDLLSDYTTPLIVLLTVFLILIYFERVFNLKEKDKIIIELILFGFIHLITIFDMLVFDFILSAFYIFYGFYKKRDSFVLFGTVLLIATLSINIFKIMNNITVTYVLLVIGLFMLGYVFYLEAKKNNKK